MSVQYGAQGCCLSRDNEPQIFQSTSPELCLPEMRKDVILTVNSVNSSYITQSLLDYHNDCKSVSNIRGI